MNTTTSLSAAMRTFYERMLLERLKPNLVHNMFGQPGRINKSDGKTINFRRYGALTAATTPLTEGTPPAGQDMSVTAITATVAQYGDFLTFSDLVQTQTVDPVIQEGITLIGEQAGQTLDIITREVLAAGTNVQYAGGVAGRSSVASSNKFSADEAAKAKRTLQANGVQPINGYFAAIIHPNTVYDLQKDPAWIDAQKYGSPEQLKNGLLGRLNGIEYYATPNAKVFEDAGASSVDVYGTLIFGRNAYGVVSYEAPEAGGINPVFGGPDQYVMPVSVIVKGLGSAGAADPLDQKSTLGWKVAHVTKRLNETAMIRVEHAVSA